MLDEPQFMDLLRAELGTAMAGLELRLVDRFASKSDLVSETNLLHVRIDKHALATDARIEKVEDRVTRSERFQNRLAGAVALGAFVIPVLTAFLTKFIG